MVDLLKSLFDTTWFMPHGHCYLWRPSILWLNVLSDALIALSYYLIPVALVLFVRRRRDLAFNWMFLMFAAFIIACGTTHVFEILTVWRPEYGIQGLVKFATGVVSIATAVILWPLMPRALALPSPTQLSEMNRSLAREVEKRTQIQKELEHREAELRLITDTLPVGVLYVDREQRCRFNNQTMRQWLTGDSANIDGMPVQDVLRSADGLTEACVKTLAGSSESFTFQIENHDRPRDIVAKTMPDRDKEGHVRGMVLMLSDVTEQLRADRELRAAKDAAVAASQAKTTFLANMSHEIRTPLGVVVGFSDLIARDCSKGLDRERYARAIRRNGKLLSTIINDILDVSAVEAGKFTIEMEIFPLSVFIEEITESLRHRAIEKGLDFSVSTQDPIPKFLCTDPQRLRQIVANLIGNAIKFTSQGRIDVVLRASVDEDGRTKLMISVADTGIGIAPEQAAILFEPFTQGDESTKRRFGGTGLGLALSKRLAELLGGDVELTKSAPNRGSVFTATVDVGKSKKTLHAAAGRSAAGSGMDETRSAKPSFAFDGSRIMLVEDSQDNQLLIGELLRNTGADVTVATEGREALTRVEELGEFDAILMDLQMPGMDGHEALAELRRRGYRKPIIALTAHAMSQERRRCLEEGFDDHLAKPIDETALFRILSDQMHTKGSRPPTRH